MTRIKRSGRSGPGGPPVIKVCGAGRRFWGRLDLSSLFGSGGVNLTYLGLAFLDAKLKYSPIIVRVPAHGREDTALLLLGYYEKWLMDRCGGAKLWAINSAPCSVPETEKARKDPGHRSGRRSSGGRWQGWAAPLGASLSINAPRLSAHVQSAWFGFGIPVRWIEMRGYSRIQSPFKQYVMISAVLWN
ncbi:hypothetical protein B0H11DRAFT_2366114 [Mycena galericulata]|nr:hypothetical protein B0H11DRAFT_2366114 [Mycena galericulata]